MILKSLAGERKTVERGRKDQNEKMPTAKVIYSVYLTL